jgi:hypothetical protein
MKLSTSLFGNANTQTKEKTRNSKQLIGILSMVKGEENGVITPIPVEISQTEYL